MKRLSWVFVALMIAAPVFAQEEGGGGGLPSSLFGGDSPGGRANEVNPMDSVKRFLLQSKVTLSGDQEKTLKPAIEAAFKLVQDTVEKFSAGQPAAGGERGERGFRGRGGQGGQGGERRGGGGRGRGEGGGAAPVPNNPQLSAELQKINDDVLAKIFAVLKPDQQSAFTKWKNDQIKKAGGFAALKIIMQEAGAPLTPEQEPQVQALYTDGAKLAEAELATMGKVAKLLTAAQRKALLDSRSK